MSTNDLDFELSRLASVIEEIKSALSRNEDFAQSSWDELRTALSSYWDERLGDGEAQHIAALDRQRRQYAMSNREREKLSRMASNPYFGRLDFVEDGTGTDLAEAEQIYIGLGGLLRPESGEILIYDWRAPVCSMFYDYERGRAGYQCPAGAVTGEIALKRQYQIRDGHLENMFDCDLQINDDILQQILGKNTDEKMRTIVYSIQQEQNRAIRDDRHRLLVIRGAAGSGKTSIALHRAAYLLYKERAKITARDIMIFSPNRVFSDYISDVLPKLNEENVAQSTFADYVRGTLSGLSAGARAEQWPEQLEYLLNAPEDGAYRLKTANIRAKSSSEFGRFIERYAVYLERRHGDTAHEISYGKHLIFPRKEWGNLVRHQLAYLSQGQRLRYIRRQILQKMRPMIKGMRREEVEAILAAGEEVNEKTIKALARLAVWRELRPLRAELERMTTLDVLALYREVFVDQDLWLRVSGGMPPPENWPAIRSFTLAQLDSGILPYEDQPHLLYLHGCLEGFPADPGIRHIIVDEAQDYTDLQYRILKHLFPHADWTILGDPDQAAHPCLRGSDFANIPAIFAMDDALLITLSRSYRSTGAIVEFARSLLPGFGPAEHMHRPGAKPVVVRVTADMFLDDLIHRMAALKEEGCRSIAVICKSKRESLRIYERIKARSEIYLVTEEDFSFQHGVSVLPVYLAKGLEFDAVVVIDAGEENYHRDWEANILYIACTRALHRLVLYYHGELSPFIRERCEGLYTAS